MTITAEQIPNEVVEAVGLSILDELDAIASETGSVWVEKDLSPEDKAFFRRVSFAAIAAALNAWPGMELVEPFSPTPGRGPALRIPIPQKEPRT